MTSKPSKQAAANLSVPYIATSAAQILDLWKNDPAFPAFLVGLLGYSDEWADLPGLPTVARWDPARDTGPLITEALRVLAIECAMYLSSRDELAARVPIPVPVNEMLLALLAQIQLFSAIVGRTGWRVIHHPGPKPLDYTEGCVTHAYYTAAWGTPPERYWLDHTEAERRRRYLDGLPRQEGTVLGRGHSITFQPA